MKSSTLISTTALAVSLTFAPLFVSLTAPFTRTATAQERLILVGLHVEKNSSLQPGLEVGYASERLLGGHPRFALSYSTTRLATAFGSNGLRKDRFLLATGWHFRPEKHTDPYIQLELGYARYDLEDPVLFALLDNEAPIAALLVGIERRFTGGVRIYGDVGYSMLHSSTVYPFIASVGMRVDVGRRVLP